MFPLGGYLYSQKKNFCQNLMKFNFGSFMIPHPDKAYKGGEDAVFVSDKILSVADGVGGWAELGVDPSLYSKLLC